MISPVVLDLRCGGKAVNQTRGSFVAVRLLEENSTLVLFAKDGEPNQSAQRPCILLGSDFISQQKCTVLDHCRLKLAVGCFSHLEGGDRKLQETFKALNPSPQT